MVFTVSAVIAEILMHAQFSILGLIPEARAGQVEEMADRRLNRSYVL